MSERIGDWIQTHSGGVLYPLDPRPEEIRIEDIAHALARIPRFTGHTKRGFGYSVAQHSVLVSERCDPVDALAGLLHDASEFGFNDIARPLKQLPEYAAIRAADERLQAAIYARFGLAAEVPASVRVADERMLATEVRDLMRPSAAAWAKWFTEIEPYPHLGINPWPPSRLMMVDLVSACRVAGAYALWMDDAFDALLDPAISYAEDRFLARFQELTQSLDDVDTATHGKKD